MPPASKHLTKAGALTELRKQIQTLEGFKGESAPHIIRLEAGDIDSHLPGGSFPLGTIHELMSESPAASAAATGFLSLLLARMAGDAGIIVWITKAKTLYAPGLVHYGLCPERIIFAECARDREGLWAMEEALRCKGLVAVVGEIDDAGLTATRRLQLAAESSGVTGFLLRRDSGKNLSSACMTRWIVKPAASIVADNLPGVGSESWQVELVRARGGRPGQWHLTWDGKKLSASKKKRAEPDKVRAFTAMTA
jgi:protein ImuA